MIANRLLLIRVEQQEMENDDGTAGSERRNLQSLAS